MCLVGSDLSPHDGTAPLASQTILRETEDAGGWAAKRPGWARNCIPSKCPQNADASWGLCFKNCPHKQWRLVRLTVAQLPDETAQTFKDHRKAWGAGKPRTLSLGLKLSPILCVP